MTKIDVNRLGDEGQRMAAAMRIAVDDALLKHKLLGQSVAVWRDGSVEILPPDKIPSPDGQTKSSVA